MKNLTELPTAGQPSLLLLNEYCLLELFDFLKFESSMNLAETCVCLTAVANRAFRKYSTMKLDNQTTETRKECIARFVSHFGHHVLSLIICTPWEPLNWRIVKSCENLKILKMRHISGDFENGTALSTIDNLEVLSFMCCDSKFVKSFLNIVSKVKALIIYDCRVKCNVLTAFFRNSPDVEIFKWSSNDTLDFHLLELISNVERLYLDVELNNVSELGPLLKLNRLSKLKLRCAGENITSFLTELAKKGIIQELELGDLAFDEKFFEMLKSFDSLHLLVLDAGSSYLNKLKTSIVWPPKLKHFQCIDFEFSLDAFLSTIKQLKYLESICFYNCWMAKGEKDNSNDVTKLSQLILAATDNCDRKQRLNVVLPWDFQFDEYSSKKFPHDSERLRIYNCTTNLMSPLRISICFPRM